MRRLSPRLRTKLVTSPTMSVFLVAVPPFFGCVVGCLYVCMGVWCEFHATVSQMQWCFMLLLVGQVISRSLVCLCMYTSLMCLCFCSHALCVCSFIQYIIMFVACWVPSVRVVCESFMPLSHKCSGVSCLCLWDRSSHALWCVRVCPHPHTLMCLRLCARVCVTVSLHSTSSCLCWTVRLGSSVCGLLCHSELGWR